MFWPPSALKLGYNRFQILSGDALILSMQMLCKILIAHHDNVFIHRHLKSSAPDLKEKQSTKNKARQDDDEVITAQKLSISIFLL